jgi:hypothetical protein
MDSLLSFFSDLILFTAGLGVLVIWIAIFLGIIIEVHDQIKEHRNKEKEL